ncbi:MAG: hypothetical protein ACE5DW_00155 [Thermodesulfobacteriota bacterium]
MSIFIVTPPSVHGQGDGFVFNTYEAVSRWHIEHVNEVSLTGGGLLLKGNNYVRISPPAGFSAPLSRVVMELRFKTTKSMVSNIRIGASDGWEARKTVRVKVLDGSDDETHLRVYFGRHAGGASGAPINNFVVEFYSLENINVVLYNLRLYEPTSLGLASVLWEEFWRPDFITGSILGFVATPQAGRVGFMTMLYVLAALAFLVVTASYRAAGRSFTLRAISRVLVIIFLAAAFVFAFRMDYGWAIVWRDHVKTLAGKDLRERTRIVNNRNFDKFFDFIEFVKRTVPEGRVLRPAVLGLDTPLAALARYYMLPLEESGEADLLWSFGESLRLDPGSGALYDGRGKLIAPRVRLFAAYAENAAIYEVIK